MSQIFVVFSSDPEILKEIVREIKRQGVRVVLLYSDQDEKRRRERLEEFEKQGVDVRTVEDKEDFRENIREIWERYPQLDVVVIVTTDDKEWIKDFIEEAKERGVEVFVVYNNKDDDRRKEAQQEFRSDGVDVRTVSDKEELIEQVRRFVRKVGSLEHHHHHH
uniref:DESIGNED PROTEIN OR32 n=1 Tax=synthetic construct TaxID=32630 RepID=UPI0001F84832|nr:Chain A, DESIGNED PROTEIN OR32 [synthetic construct]